MPQTLTIPFSSMALEAKTPEQLEKRLFEILKLLQGERFSYYEQRALEEELEDKFKLGVTRNLLVAPSGSTFYHLKYAVSTDMVDYVRRFAANVEIPVEALELVEIYSLELDAKEIPLVSAFNTVQRIRKSLFEADHRESVLS